MITLRPRHFIMTICAVVAVTAVAPWTASPTLAQEVATPAPPPPDVEAGIAAYRKMDYKAALAELEPAAEAGDRRAAFHLGLMREKGEGVKPNAALAFSWYARAAAKGHVEARYRMGVLYKAGRGVPLSPADAMAAFLKGVDKEHPASMVAAAEMYLAGHGVKPDVYRAQELLARAAALGSGEAQARMEALIADGRMSRPPLPGETDPADPETARVLADLKRMLKPYRDGALDARLSLAEPIHIAKRADDYLAYLPGAELSSRVDGSRIKLGTVRIAMARNAPGRYDLDVVLPGAVTIEEPGGQGAMRVAVGRQKTVMTWDMTLGSAVAMDLAYDDLSFGPADGPAMMRINAVKVGLETTEPAPGRMDGRETVEIAGVSMGMPGQPGTVAMDKIALDTRFDGFDVAAYKALLKKAGIDWERGAVVRGQGIGGLPIKMTDLVGMLGGLSSVTRIEGVSIDLGQPAMMPVRFASLRVGMTGTGLDGDAAEIRLAGGYDGMEAGAVELGGTAPPSAVDLAILARRVPLRSLAGRFDEVLVDLAMMGMLAPGAVEGGQPMPPVAFTGLADAIGEAGMEIVVEKGDIAGADYGVKLSGTLTLARLGDGLAPSGLLLVEARGLDGIAARAAMNGGGEAVQGAGLIEALATLRKTAEISVDAAGETVHAFRLRFTPGQPTRVNGKTLDELAPGAPN